MLLKKSLNFAAEFTHISEDDRILFFHTRKSFLVSDNEYWNKKKNEQFDVAMGGFDSVEISDICGLFLLSLLSKLNLYRDDGLLVCNLTPRQAELKKKEICQIFKDNGLKIKILANQKVVNFLDITLDIDSGVFKPFMKPNDTPLYINTKSNHPPSILRNIPLGVNRRLIKISANLEVFDEAMSVLNKN